MTKQDGEFVLAPCPFCGGDAFVIEDRGDNACEPLLHRPQCKACGGGLGGFDYEAEAVEAWNRRASPPPPVQREPAPGHTDLMVTPESIGPWLDVQRGEVDREAIARITRKLVADARHAATLRGERDLADKAADAILTLSQQAPAPTCNEGLQIEGWRDIASAPRDGTAVLLFGTQEPFDGLRTNGPFAFSGYWDDIDGSWCSSGSTWVGPFYQATHWMPLPPAPSTP